MILGAVLAGGQSRRFGSDKALAQLAGRTLLEQAVERLGGLCDAVVVVGRENAPARVLADWPAPGMGPLGGLAAALLHARESGCDAVLTCGVDSIGLPDDIVARLSPMPGYVDSQPVIGLWPAATAEALQRQLAGDGKHSVMAFARAIGARPVKLDREPDNINTPADLDGLEQRHGL